MIKQDSNSTSNQTLQNDKPRTIETHSDFQELASEIGHKDNESDETLSPFAIENNQIENKLIEDHIKTDYDVNIETNDNLSKNQYKSIVSIEKDDLVNNDFKINDENQFLLSEIKNDSLKRVESKDTNNEFNSTHKILQNIKNDNESKNN